MGNNTGVTDAIRYYEFVQQLKYQYKDYKSFNKGKCFSYVEWLEVKLMNQTLIK